MRRGLIRLGGYAFQGGPRPAPKPLSPQLLRHIRCSKRRLTSSSLDSSQLTPPPPGTDDMALHESFLTSVKAEDT
ncbi:unnamed protein product, partial [Chrysoparadoxa australica]